MLSFAMPTKAKCKGTTEEISEVQKEKETIVKVIVNLINRANV